MDRFYPVLKTSPLFREFDDNELSHLLDCFRAKLTEYEKDEIIFLQGSTILMAGFVVQGSIRAHREDRNGNIKILSDYSVCETFSEELLFSGIAVAPFTLSANEQTKVIYFDCSEISKFCRLACPHHSKFVMNLLQMMSSKIVRMDRKMEIVQKGTIREKLISYLNFCAEQEKSNNFIIPFSRQGLADYIGVNRSAVSRELWKMKKEGIVSFENRRFILDVSNK
jgi:CRP-like cAMP-binding protein